MESIATRLSKIHVIIHNAELNYQRAPNSVKLLAVSKGQSISNILAAAQAGQKSFGENYLQEALDKIIALKQQNLQWHFIGSIQANKTKAIAGNFQWVETITRLKIAERLNQQRPLNLPPLNVCIEVNVSNEKTKAGISLAEVKPLAMAIKQMPQLKLRGLMTIPAPSNDFEQQRNNYKTLQQAYLELCKAGFNLDTLSMGMSNDYVAAIAEGSTQVRVGTAIFGPR